MQVTCHHVDKLEVVQTFFPETVGQQAFYTLHINIISEDGTSLGELQLYSPHLLEVKIPSFVEAQFVSKD